MVFAFFKKRVKNKDNRFVLIGTRMKRMLCSADETDLNIVLFAFKMHVPIKN